ncbi:AsmA family protein [Marinicella sediminis]|uniref:AsmA family protein n=1 Tax=Marinicella sediminis TaxID=1792834 RepID=A0ABV7JBX5_9GAMM|nr:AsmA family protein [Marinicella sediminis]
MKKLIKWMLGLVAGLVVLLVLAIILLPVFFDPNDHKPRIQQMAADTIGREVVLNGPIKWSVFPWLAINLKDVSIANESGFKGDHLAQVEQVAVRVKLLPLLSQQIQVGQVELQKPEIRLQVAGSGKSNWQSMLDHLAAEPADSGQQGEGGTSLAIEGIIISEGSLTYVDGGADLQVNMTDLRFTSDAIQAGSPTAMSLASQVALPAQAMQGRLQADWQANHLADEQPVVMTFAELSYEGAMDGVTLSLDSPDGMLLDLGNDQLSLNQLALRYGPMKLVTEVKGENLSQQMKLSGALKMEAFALSELLAQMGSPLDNQAENEFSGALNWVLAGDRLQLKDVQARLDDSQISGSVDITQLSALKGRFELNLDQLNLDQYVPVSDATASTSAATEVASPMDLGQMNGQIKLGSLQAAGVQMKDITLNVSTRGTAIRLEPLQAGFYQGLIRTELQLDPQKTSQKLSVSHRMRDFQAGGLLADLIGSEYLTGLGQLEADITVDEPFSAEPLKTANGSLSYQLRDGDIVGIDVFQIMQQSLSLLNKTDAMNNSDELKTAFGLMDIQADVNQGVLTTRALKIDSPYFNLTGQVSIDLNQQTINGTIRPMLTNIPEGVMDQRFEKLLNLRIPVSLKGELMAPAVSIDLQKLILETQKAKIDEKKEELKEDLFDAILGSDKDKGGESAEASGDEAGQPMTDDERKKAEKDQLKRNLLEGLFKSAKQKDKDKKDQSDDDNGGGN